MENETDYRALNAELNIYDENGLIQFDKDKKAARSYFLNDINKNTVFFHSLEEKLNYLFENEYYEKEVFDKYSDKFIKKLFKQAYEHKFRFQSYLGANKFYTSYAMKTFDGDRLLERYEDRIVVTAIALANGDEKLASELVDEIISGRFQPATPTFLNSGKKQRGEPVSCFLLKMSDSMESIGRSITNALQLSKRGGGVAFNLTDLRETGAPIKKMENQSSGVIPVMKMFEDAFSYANQLGQRSGAGAVWLSAHHPDIMKFLDTKRENADEKVRIKTLSLGVVETDIMFELAKKDEDMYLFSPYDVQRVYGIPMSEISITEKYYEMVDNPEIKKTKINVREYFQTKAQIQSESGYPYTLFEDTANRSNPIDGRINMSNLCSEILQINTASSFNPDGSYDVVGKDISCNLGSMNVAKAMESSDFSKTVEVAIRALSAVSDTANIESVPSIDKGNKSSHAIGLGQMNLASYFAKEKMYYGSEESVDFTNIYFYIVLFNALSASNKIAMERKEVFEDFEKSKYATGEFFDKYLDDSWKPKTKKVLDIFKKANIHIPTQSDWLELSRSIKKYGIYNRNLQAVAPTGSISYINNSSASIHPITAKIEIRKEGKIGRVYFPAPYLTNENQKYFEDAYEIGYEKIIDVYAAATQHVDQGLSCTLFFKDGITTREMNKAYIYAWKSGLKTLYYFRMRQMALEGTEIENCVSCAL